LPLHDDTPFGIAIVGLDGLVERVNQPLCELLEREQQDVVGSRLDDLLQIAEGDGLTPRECTWVTPDGRTNWGLSTTRRQRDHFICHVLDVTAQRRAAEELRAANDGYRWLLEQGRDGVWVFDHADRTVSVSDSLAEMLGRDAAEMLGKPPQAFTDAEGAALLDDALERRRAGVRETYELKWRHSDGHEVWGLVSASPLADERGRFAGTFALITDITARRATEDRLGRYARQQEEIARLGRLALEGMALPALFEAAAECVAAVLGAEAAELVPAPFEPSPASFSVRVAGRADHGALAVRGGEDWEPAPDERTFLEAVANTLAAAVERAEAESEMRRRALHDPLTGLPNRTLVLDRLAHALAARGRREGTTAVVLLDIDQFKVVNDSLGHDAGDQLLLAVAPRLVDAVRPGDTVGRLGGDEFVVVCEGVADGAGAAAVAARLVEAFDEPFVLDGEEHHLTASVGIASAEGGTQAPGELLRNADTAMYLAKERGRARFETFDEELRARTLERVRIERDLREAVARDQLTLDFQPIVRLADGEIEAFEALVRWRHPERGLVPPDRFIGVAEDAGLIGAIGAWVLREACARAAAWQSVREVTLHVNLSARQVSNPALPALVAETLERTGLHPALLALEITETTLMDEGPAGPDVLGALKALGVGLVLDDFGTGYSSLSRLRRFPITGLKVDRSFVAELGDGPRTSGLIVAGIVQMTHALGLDSVAEGIETEAQADRLRELGCKQAQGFRFARPMDAGAAGRLLEAAAPLPALA
jgi:diguanylate cyclase (GGDEF)-like protein/PAS domain S-box-containing protein